MNDEIQDKNARRRLRLAAKKPQEKRFLPRLSLTSHEMLLLAKARVRDFDEKYREQSGMTKVAKACVALNEKLAPMSSVNPYVGVGIACAGLVLPVSIPVAVLHFTSNIMSQILLNAQRQHENLLEGYEGLVPMLFRYNIYIMRTFDYEDRVQEEYKKSYLERDMRDLLSDIFKYQAMVVNYLRRTKLDKIVRDIRRADEWRTQWDKIKRQDVSCTTSFNTLNEIDDSRQRAESYDIMFGIYETVEEMSKVQKQQLQVEIATNQTLRESHEIQTQQLDVSKGMQERLTENGKSQSELLSVSRAVEVHLAESKEIQSKQLDVLSRVLDHFKEQVDRECFTALYNDYLGLKNSSPARVSNTCMWVLNHHKYWSWKDTSNSLVLWIRGYPGSGKSTLTRAIIDEQLYKDFESTQQIPCMCYFFFKGQASQSSSSSQAMTALIHQLVVQDPGLIGPASRQYTIARDKLVESRDRLKTILHDILSMTPKRPVYLFLDALDECAENDRDDVFDIIADAIRIRKEAESENGFIKCFITSRPYTTVIRPFRNLESQKQLLTIDGEDEAELISQEVADVIREEVPRLALFLDLSEVAEKSVLDKFLSMPHKTYLWAELMFRALRSTDSEGVSTPRSLQKFLSDLPNTATEAYEQMLNRSRRPKLGRRILSIILAATRALSLQELRMAVALDDFDTLPDDSELEDDEHFADTARNACGLLITISNGSVYLIHETMKA